MSKLFNIGGGDPGLWHLYLNRPEHQNLPLNEVRRRYLLEQADFQQFMMMKAQSSLAASPGGRAGSSGAQEAGGSGQRQGSSRPDDLVLTILDATNDLDDLYALIYVAPDEDARTSQAYYEVWEDYTTRVSTLNTYDLANSYVFAQNPSNNQWNQYRYNDFIQGEYKSGVTYTDYEGTSVTSEGPSYNDTDKTGITPTGNWDNDTVTIGGVWNHANLTNAVVDSTNISPSYFVRITHNSGSSGDAYDGVQFVTQSNSLTNETTQWHAASGNGSTQLLSWSEGFTRSDDSTNFYGWRLQFTDTFDSTNYVYGSGSSDAHPLSPFLLSSASLGYSPMFGNSHFTRGGSDSKALRTVLLIPTDTKPSFTECTFTYNAGKGSTTATAQWVGMRNGYGVYKTIPFEYDPDQLNLNKWVYWDGNGWVAHSDNFFNSSSQVTYVSTDPLDPSGVYDIGGATHTIGGVG